MIIHNLETIWYFSREKQGGKRTRKGKSNVLEKIIYVSFSTQRNSLQTTMKVVILKKKKNAQMHVTVASKHIGQLIDYVTRSNGDINIENLYFCYL